jgi:hypothetical protein
MTKRAGRQDITPEKVRVWLRMHEEEGMSIPKIAKKQVYDVRTVRKYIELSRSEQEFHEARLQVLKEKLVKHYDNLCSFASKLKEQFDLRKPESITLLSEDDILMSALREHLPRLRTWRDMDQWNKSVSSYEEVMKKIKDIIFAEGVSRSSHKFFSENKEGFFAGLEFHLKNRAIGHDGLDKMDYNISNTPTGKRVARGSFGLAIVPDSEISKVQKLLDSLVKDSIRWEECNDLNKPLKELDKISHAIDKELTKVAMRGVLPGKCSFCPF